MKRVQAPRPIGATGADRLWVATSLVGVYVEADSAVGIIDRHRLNRRKIRFDDPVVSVGALRLGADRHRARGRTRCVADAGDGAAGKALANRRRHRFVVRIGDQRAAATASARPPRVLRRPPFRSRGRCGSPTCR